MTINWNIFKDTIKDKLKKIYLSLKKYTNYILLTVIVKINLEVIKNAKKYYYALI